MKALGLALGGVAAAGCGRFWFDPVPDGPDAVQCTAWSPFSAPVVLPGPVLSAVDDWTPSPTRGELEIYFHSYRDSVEAQLYRGTRQQISDPFGAATLVVETDTASGQQFSPTLTADGLLLVYADSSSGPFKLTQATRSAADASFDTPAEMPVVNSGPTADDNYPALTADGLRLVLASTRLGANHRVFEARRSDRASAFSTPVELDTANPGNAEDWSPSLSADGLDLYFSSTRGEVGGFDIYTAHRDNVDQPFVPPKLIPELSSTGDDIGPKLQPDNATLYFNYNADTGGGNADIWVSRRTCM
jgi:WD40-like Beta Propeller Repeat